MSIGVIFTGEGMTQAQYDEVCQEVMPDNRPVRGLLFHAGGPGEAGWRVIEVWESQEAAETFFAGKLDAAFQRANIAADKTEFFQVHNVIQR